MASSQRIIQAVACRAAMVSTLTTCLSVGLAGCRSLSSPPQDSLARAFSSKPAPLLDKPLADPSSVSEKELCLQTAQSLARHGHLAEAIALLQRAEASSPDEPPLDRQLAPLLAQSKQFERSLQRYRRALQLSPRDLELRNNFAWTLMEADQYEEAEREIRRGLDQDPDNERLQSALAILYYRTGRGSEAFEQFAAAIGPASAYYNLAILAIDSGNIEQAQHYAEASLQAEPRDETRRLVRSIAKAAEEGTNQMPRVARADP